MQHKLVTLILFIAMTSGTAFGVITVSETTCNYDRNPINVNDLKPQLSWKITSTMRGINQLAYQIVVSSDPNFNVTTWDSGKILSDQSLHVPYAGPALKFSARYYWKVTVWASDGSVSSSEPAFWEMTLDQNQWKADWISAPSVFDLARLNSHRYAMIRGEKHDFLEALPLYRKAFNITKKIKQAKVYVAGLGFHELYVNGKKVSDEILNPAFTNYDHTVLYNAYDVTALVKLGGNAFGMILGNGWYNSVSKEVWGFDMAPWRNLPTLKLQMEIVYVDDSTETIVSDTSWKATPGPIIFSNVRQGEYYDARKEIKGWSEADFNDTDWKNVRKVAGPIGTLRPHNLPPVKVHQTIRAVNSRQLPNGNMVYDFGQNMSGFIAVRLAGKKGSRVQFKYGERLNADGSVDQSNINNLLSDSLFQIDRYTLKGGGEESWSPKFVYHGFRYAEASFDGDVPEMISVAASAISTSFKNTGEFSCSNELINKIQQSTLWSYRNNFVGFPTDCPQREKNGWTGDAQLACETGLSNFDAVTAYKKWLGDLRDEQQQDGKLPGIVPTNGWGYYWGNGPAWDIACIMIPWSIYRYTGDTRILEENYSMMQKYVDYMRSRSPEYIADFGLGDWIPVKTTTPDAVTSTGYFHFGASVLAKSAAVLGRAGDQQKYSEMARQIELAFNKKFFNKKDFTYANGSQTALTFALAHNFTPLEYRSKVTGRLVEAVHSKGDHIDCGILGARYIQHVLTDNGYPQLAFDLVNTRTYPGWGYWIENGATTLWEDWKGESSLNHIMLGDVSSWFYKTIGGIQPDNDAPGFKQFIIAPTLMKGLSSASSSYESGYGKIVSNWNIENGMLTHKISVPPNSKAMYILPSGISSTVSESGKALSSTNLKVTGTSNGRSTITLLSGDYIFTAQIKN